METAGELAARLAPIGGRLLVKTISGLQDGTLAPIPQDHSRATLAPLLKKEDGMLRWEEEATALANRIRGLTPWPGAYTYFKDHRWTIWRAVAEPGQGTAPMAAGTLLEAGKAGLVVTTGKGVLRILELQAANSRRMEAREYVAGHPLASGTLLSSAAGNQ
jgi:methionyl-tRNA formyltransferase